MPLLLMGFSCFIYALMCLSVVGGRRVKAVYIYSLNHRRVIEDLWLCSLDVVVVAVFVGVVGCWKFLHWFFFSLFPFYIGESGDVNFVFPQILLLLIPCPFYSSSHRRSIRERSISWVLTLRICLLPLVGLKEICVSVTPVTRPNKVMDCIWPFHLFSPFLLQGRG